MEKTRWSSVEDSEAIALVHGDAWRHAYAGIIPGLSLERMVAARGPRWWIRMHGAGMRALVIESEGQVVGYATLGRSRGFHGAGEIYELYLEPRFQGLGLGRHLFTDARNHLRSHGLPSLHVWALADNEIGCRFYRALGGTPWARAPYRIGDRALDRIGFRWT